MYVRCEGYVLLGAWHITTKMSLYRPALLDILRYYAERCVV